MTPTGIQRGLVADPAVADAFREIAGYRNRLIHHYDEVTAEELFTIVREHLDELDAVARELRSAARRLVGD
jgi:uncharacterized protein YutE (UPF0331/DUF86 family)